MGRPGAGADYHIQRRHRAGGCPNQLDFLNYTTALKGNYRKGVFKLRAIMGNPTHAAEFAANLGGVSVVLGVPISAPDKNSADLLALLLASSVADAAITTWLTQWYEFDGIDGLQNDAGVCSACWPILSHSGR